MKKIIMLIMLLMTFTGCFKPDNFTTYYHEGRGFLIYNHDKIYTGKYKTYYSEYDENSSTISKTTLMEDGYVKDGKKHGKYRRYWEDNKPNIIATYNMGKLIGNYKEYYRKGALQMEANYDKDGYLIDSKEWWRETGKLMRTRVDSKDGFITTHIYFKDIERIDEEVKKKRGTTITSSFYYHKNGKYSNIIKTIETYVKEGKLKTEESIKYYDTGEVLLKKYKKNGKNTGTWQGFLPDGFMHLQQEWLDGKKHGTWLSYDTKTKKIEYDHKYVNDYKQGICKDYQNGVLIKEMEFDKGSSVGIYKSYYYPSGKVNIIGTHDSYRYKTGDWTKYSENGKILFIYRYRNRQLYSSTEYNEDGNIISEKKYPKYTY